MGRRVGRRYRIKQDKERDCVEDRDKYVKGKEKGEKNPKKSEM